MCLLKGSNAVFQCGKHIIRGRIIKKEEGSLTDVLKQDNYKNIVPSAQSLEEATAYLKRLYGTDEGAFTAYSFELEKNTAYLNRFYRMDKKEVEECERRGYQRS